ncbi:hypothetical protein KY338_05180 [Candidatus Woesearchaeota archaeon]|nr:hypothetical protein [Candidatus Woesearchaeota archaeon]MBW3005543.1 hypothetical protein [Candidatus Woesearchaeota archaeon]
MIFELFETKSGPGLVARIEARTEWDGYNYLLAELSAFCARKRYQLQERQYEEFRIVNHKKTWYLPVATGDGNGVITISYLGDTYLHRLGRGWTAQKFWIFFNFSEESIGLSFRREFKENR